MRIRDGARTRNDSLAALDAHGVYLSDPDEAELIRRIAVADDVGLLALRTCLCGVRIDGFDEYWDHLREILAQLSS